MKFYVSLVAAGLMSATAANATVISGSSLQNAINAAGGIVDVNTEQHGLDEEWRVGAVGIAASRIQFELSGYAGSNSFGIYDTYNTASRLSIFSGSDSAGAFGFLFNPTGSNFCTATFATIASPTCASFSTAHFGFYLSTPGGNTYFSQDILNADGVDHLVAFEGGPTRGSLNGSPWLANEYLLAWEDIYGGGDRDYEDFVVLVESVIGVPEPTGLALFGAGLLAIGFAARKRSNGATLRR